MTKAALKTQKTDLTIQSVSALTEPDKRNKALSRFWKKVSKTDHCWIWLGAHNRCGYGMFLVEQGKTRGAHRWIYEQTYGPIPKDQDICHRCDNRSCVNPAHLWSGTAKENLRDMCLKGRHASMPMAPHRTGERLLTKAERVLVAEYHRHHPLSKSCLCPDCISGAGIPSAWGAA